MSAPIICIEGVDYELRTITVSIDKECIKKGKRRSMDACPIALAMWRAGFYKPNVSLSDSRLTFGEIFIQRSGLPESAAEFIRAFDNHKKVKPFTFEVEAYRLAHLRGRVA